MATPALSLDSLTLNLVEEIHVAAPLETTFKALLEQLGPGNEHPDGTPMPMKLEAFPGGRWFRDLGGNSGHFWGHVQAIKEPTLLEIVGPLFMSYPVASNVQYRLSEEPGGTLIKFHHKALGVIQEEHRQGVTKGWGYIHSRAKARAEGKRGK
jgi:activator of Hsp90 ATPase-like protein